MPKVYGWEHLTYLAVCVVLAVVSIFLIKKYVKSEKTLTLIVKILGGVLFACIAWNRISLSISHKNAMRLLPDTVFTWWFCGILLLVFSYIVMSLFEYFRVWKKSRSRTTEESADGDNLS